MAIKYPNAQVHQPPVVDYAKLLELGKQLLVAIGEDPEREGLLDTPRRWASWWCEFIEYQPGNMDTTFQTIHADQMVVVSGIRVWSLCEHHLLPFHSDIAIGYITDARVLGLSKFGRLAHQAAHRLQVQERLVQQIADDVQHATGTPSVAVLAQGEHLCMTMRGVKTPATMTTSVMRGRFRDSESARSEFMAIVKGR